MIANSNIFIIFSLFWSQLINMVNTIIKSITFNF